MLNKTNKIFFISYYYNLPGACQAEWASDRVDALNSLGHDVTVLTSFVSSKSNNKEKIIRIPSAGFKDARDEFSYYSQQNKPNFLEKCIFLFFTLVGLPFDLIIVLLTRKVGEGRWMWAITAILRALFSPELYKSDYIISTGGPASSHLAAIVLSKILQKKSMIELQDPMSGEGIGRDGSRGLLKKMEHFLLKHSSISVFVTRTAAMEASMKYKINNIDYIYPGAPSYNFSLKTKEKFDAIRMVHMGSLYGTRNLKNLIYAIQNLEDHQREKFSISNIGHVDADIVNQESYGIKIDFLPHTTRDKAMKQAIKFDIMLLIQNTDGRSAATIPFKTYDYLQIGMPILALLNCNEELKEMLQSNGHIVADINSIDDISLKLKFILETRLHPKIPLDLVPSEAARKMIQLLNNL